MTKTKIFSIKSLSNHDFNDIISMFSNQAIGIIPTDTIYGIAGMALNQNVVERIYKLRHRNLAKPMIILISSIKDLDKFSIKLNKVQNEFIKKFWPGSVSIILPCENQKLSYLHRGTKSLAFRLAKDNFLQNLIKKTNPLVCPSANFEGDKPAESIKEAKAYFKNKVDFYVNKGILRSESSTVVDLRNKEINIMRQGKIKISY
ncbi:MAG: L-threonylcarbamoyladenylate synthase [bacterium]|nr:L-threonylcarbamoyladenylate synthase [bacterium]